MNDSHPSPLAHWPLDNDLNNHGPHQLVTEAVDVSLNEVDGRRGAHFDGHSSQLRIADHPAMQWADHDFTIAMWLHTDAVEDDVVGDLISKFDPTTHTGWQLSVVTNGGMPSTSQANRRHLQFGIDQDRLDSSWQDCGRPGDATLVAALLSSNGMLYATTLETAADRSGRLWCYSGGQQWTDLGNPVGCNVLHSIADFDGALHVGTGRYIGQGSQLGALANRTPGGRVFRVEADGQWIDIGHPGHEDATPETEPDKSLFNTGKADDATALTVYQGNLYCISNHRNGVFRYEGDQTWTGIGPERRMLTLAVYRRQLYGLCNGNGMVLRYEADGEWSPVGRIGDSSQVYSGCICEGDLYSGVFPEGAVFCYEPPDQWRPVHHRRGWVGFESEVMGMAMYNGMMYAGSLPSAFVYRMDEDRWTNVGCIDPTPVNLRRAWTFAVHDGRLYGGTLPTGKVWSLQAGVMATADRVLPGGWRHITAVRRGGHLELFLDGQLISQSWQFHPQHFQLDNAQPLRIGMGRHEHLAGTLSDVRLYGEALRADQISELSRV